MHENSCSSVLQFECLVKEKIASLQESSTSVTVTEITIDWEKCVVATTIQNPYAEIVQFYF